MEREQVEITVFDSDDLYDDIPVAPDKFMKFFQDIIDKIPKEHLRTARVELDSSTDRHYDSLITLLVYYTREETDEEVEIRLKKEKETQAQKDELLKKEQREKDLKELKRLRELYPNE